MEDSIRAYLAADLGLMGGTIKIELTEKSSKGIDWIHLVQVYKYVKKAMKLLDP
jgi:hypothetical protein